MKIGRIGSVQNYGGVVNLGTIHGDVVNSVNRSLGEASSQDDGMREELRSRLVTLANAIQTHAEDVHKPDDALKRVEKVSEEVASEQPDKPLLMRYLDLIRSAATTAQPVIACVAAVSKLVEGMTG